MNFFSINFQNILLRELLEEDLTRYLRWHLEETEWQNWDAPWEEDTSDIEEIKGDFYKRLNRPRPEIWSRLQICHTDGTHLGWTSAYYIDSDNPTQLAVGLDLPEREYWGRGLGEQALRLWMGYLFSKGSMTDLYCETWSGNLRMIRLAEKVGFVEVRRFEKIRKIGGELYDGLAFKVSRSDFVQQNQELMESLVYQL